MLTPAQKAKKTKQDKFESMSPQQKAWVTRRRKEAAKKAWETRRKNLT